MLLSNQIFKIIVITVSLNCVFKHPFIEPVSLKTTTSFNKNKGSLLKQNDTVNASIFGVKADYNGTFGTDNRKALQLAIDYCSKNKKILKLPIGKVLLNSYAPTLAAQAHGNILELRSNLKIIGNHSEIVVGKFFHNRGFIVFSGFNAPDTKNFKPLTNVILRSFTINFNASQSFMQTRYLLRKGIEMGHTINGEISHCKFINGDLSCAVATGFGNENLSRNIQVHNNEFQNLAFSKQNIDHTSVYLNSINSAIYDNKFTSTQLQNKLMACAAELHSSNTSFVNNKVVGYTRMMFLVTTPSENVKISNLTITKNEASITNAAIYLWLEKNTSIDGILIANNSITSNHIPGFSMLYNGTQGIVADSKNEDNTSIQNMSIINNKTSIKNTVISGRAVNYATKYNFKNVNNSCTGCKDGLFYR